MGGEGGSKGGAGPGACRFMARMEHYLYCGEKKHLFVIMLIFGAIFGAPWFLMNQGSKHQSHQDYMEKANKARSIRLSSGQLSPKQ